MQCIKKRNSKIIRYTYSAIDNSGNTHSNDLDKANLLNNYFSSVCTLDDGLTPDVAPLVS